MVSGPDKVESLAATLEQAKQMIGIMLLAQALSDQQIVLNIVDQLGSKPPHQALQHGRAERGYPHEDVNQDEPADTEQVREPLHVTTQNAESLPDILARLVSDFPQPLVRERADGDVVPRVAPVIEILLVFQTLSGCHTLG